MKCICSSKDTKNLIVTNVTRFSSSHFLPVRWYFTLIVPILAEWSWRYSSLYVCYLSTPPEGTVQIQYHRMHNKCFFWFFWLSIKLYLKPHLWMCSQIVILEPHNTTAVLVVTLFIAAFRPDASSDIMHSCKHTHVYLWPAWKWANALKPLLGGKVLWVLSLQLAVCPCQKSVLILSSPLSPKARLKTHHFFSDCDALQLIVFLFNE